MLTDLLRQFTGQFAGGYAFILPYAESILYYMVAIEVVVLGLFWALGVGNILVDAIRKILLIGFFTYIIFQFPTIHHAIMESMISVGLAAGGGNVSIHGFANPSWYFDHGVDLASTLLNNIPWSDMLAGPGIVMSLAALGVVLGFGILSFQIIATLIEFYALSVIGVFLLPFGVFRHLSFIAEKTFGMIVGFAIKLLVLAFIVSVIDPIIGSLDLVPEGERVSYPVAFSAMGASFIIGWISWSIPSMAASLLTGGPSLTAGGAAQTALAAGIGAGAGVMATVATVSTGVSAMVGATKLAAGATSAASLASATEAMGGGSRLSQLGAGLKGAAKFGAQTAASSVNRISTRFKAAAEQGRIAGYKNTGGAATPGMERKIQQLSNASSNVAPAWANRALSAGRMARYAIPNESQPHGASHAPISKK